MRIKNAVPFVFVMSLPSPRRTTRRGHEQTSGLLPRGRGLARLPANLGVTVCYDSEFFEAGGVGELVC